MARRISAIKGPGTNWGLETAVVDVSTLDTIQNLFSIYILTHDSVSSTRALSVTRISSTDAGVTLVTDRSNRAKSLSVDLNLLFGETDFRYFTVIVSSGINKFIQEGGDALPKTNITSEDLQQESLKHELGMLYIQDTREFFELLESGLEGDSHIFTQFKEFQISLSSEPLSFSWNTVFPGTYRQEISLVPRQTFDFELKSGMIHTTQHFAELQITLTGGSTSAGTEPEQVSISIAKHLRFYSEDGSVVKREDTAVERVDVPLNTAFNISLNNLNTLERITEDTTIHEVEETLSIIMSSSPGQGTITSPPRRDSNNTRWLGSGRVIYTQHQNSLPVFYDRVTVITQQDRAIDVARSLTADNFPALTNSFQLVSLNRPVFVGNVEKLPFDPDGPTYTDLGFTRYRIFHHSNNAGGDIEFFAGNGGLRGDPTRFATWRGASNAEEEVQSLVSILVGMLLGCVGKYDLSFGRGIAFGTADNSDFNDSLISTSIYYKASYRSITSSDVGTLLPTTNICDISTMNQRIDSGQAQPRHIIGTIDEIIFATKDEDGQINEAFHYKLDPNAYDGVNAISAYVPATDVIYSQVELRNPGIYSFLGGKWTELALVADDSDLGPAGTNSRSRPPSRDLLARSIDDIPHTFLQLTDTPNTAGSENQVLRWRNGVLISDDESGGKIRTGAFDYANPENESADEVADRNTLARTVATLRGLINSAGAVTNTPLKIPRRSEIWLSANPTNTNFDANLRSFGSGDSPASNSVGWEIRTKHSIALKSWYILSPTALNVEEVKISIYRTTSAGALLELIAEQTGETALLDTLSTTATPPVNYGIYRVLLGNAITLSADTIYRVIVERANGNTLQVFQFSAFNLDGFGYLGTSISTQFNHNRQDFLVAPKVAKYEIVALNETSAEGTGANQTEVGKISPFLCEYDVVIGESADAGTGLTDEQLHNVEQIPQLLSKTRDLIDQADEGWSASGYEFALSAAEPDDTVTAEDYVDEYTYTARDAARYATFRVPTGTDIGGLRARLATADDEVIVAGSQMTLTAENTVVGDTQTALENIGGGTTWIQDIFDPGTVTGDAYGKPSHFTSNSSVSTILSALLHEIDRCGSGEIKVQFQEEVTGNSSNFESVDTCNPDHDTTAHLETTIAKRITYLRIYSATDSNEINEVYRFDAANNAYSRAGQKQTEAFDFWTAYIHARAGYTLTMQSHDDSVFGTKFTGEVPWDSVTGVPSSVGGEVVNQVAALETLTRDIRDLATVFEDSGVEFALTNIYPDNTIVADTFQDEFTYTASDTAEYITVRVDANEDISTYRAYQENPDGETFTVDDFTLLLEDHNAGLTQSALSSIGTGTWVEETFNPTTQSNGAWGTPAHFYEFGDASRRTIISALLHELGECISGEIKIEYLHVSLGQSDNFQSVSTCNPDVSTTVWVPSGPAGRITHLRIYAATDSNDISKVYSFTDPGYSLAGSAQGETFDFYVARMTARTGYTLKIQQHAGSGEGTEYNGKTQWRNIQGIPTNFEGNIAGLDEMVPERGDFVELFRDVGGGTLQAFKARLINLPGSTTVIPVDAGYSETLFHRPPGSHDTNGGSLTRAIDHYHEVHFQTGRYLNNTTETYPPLSKQIVSDYGRNGVDRKLTIAHPFTPHLYDFSVEYALSFATVNDDEDDRYIHSLSGVNSSTFYDYTVLHESETAFSANADIALSHDIDTEGYDKLIFVTTGLFGTNDYINENTEIVLNDLAINDQFVITPTHDAAWRMELTSNTNVRMIARSGTDRGGKIIAVYGVKAKTGRVNETELLGQHQIGTTHNFSFPQLASTFDEIRIEIEDIDATTPIKQYPAQTFSKEVMGIVEAADTSASEVYFRYYGSPDTGDGGVAAVQITGTLWNVVSVDADVNVPTTRRIKRIIGIRYV